MVLYPITFCECFLVWFPYWRCLMDNLSFFLNNKSGPAQENEIINDVMMRGSVSCNQALIKTSAADPIALLLVIIIICIIVFVHRCRRQAGASEIPVWSSLTPTTKQLKFFLCWKGEFSKNWRAFLIGFVVGRVVWGVSRQCTYWPVSTISCMSCLFNKSRPILNSKYEMGQDFN